MNINKIASRVASKVVEAGVEDLPEFKEVTLRSPSVNGKDVIAVGIAEKYGEYMLHLFNPNRGGTYYPIKKSTDVAKLKSAFDKVMDDVASVVEKHEKEYNKFLKDKWDKMQEENGKTSSDKQEEYQQYFKNKLDKFDVESPAELDEDEKSEFFDEVDEGWDAEDEKSVKGRRVKAYILDRETIYKMNDTANRRDILSVIGSVRAIVSALQGSGFKTNQINDFLIHLVTTRR
jgi:hypothetical protein